MIEQFFDEFKRKYQDLNKTSTIFAAITLPMSLIVLILLMLSDNLWFALVPVVISVILLTIIIIISIIIVNNNDKMSELEPNVFEVRGDVKFHRFCRKFKINRSKKSPKTTVGNFVKEKLGNDLAKDKRFDFEHLTISVRELEDLRVIRVVVELKPEQKDNDVNITQENSENGKGLSRKLKCTIKQLRTRLSSFVRTRLSPFDVFTLTIILSTIFSWGWWLAKGSPMDNKNSVLVIAINVLMVANIGLTALNFGMRSLPSKTYPNEKVYKSCFIAVVVGVLLILVWVACLFELNNDKSNYINRSADELSSPSPTQLTEESAPIGTVQDVDNEVAPTESTSPEQPTPTQLTEESAPIGTVQDVDNEAAPTASPSPKQPNEDRKNTLSLLRDLGILLVVVYSAYWLVDRIVEKPVIKSSDIVNMTKELLSEHEMLDEKSIDMLCEFCKTGIEDRVFGDKKERVLLLIAILGVTAEGMFEKWAGSLVDNHRIVLDITVMAVVLLAYIAGVSVMIRGIHAKEKLKLEREMLFALKTIKCNLKGSAFE